MKKAFLYGLLAAMAITGCQAELEVITQEPSKEFTAIVDEDLNSETKTSLDGEGNVLWKMGDQVSIFAASTVNKQYQVTDDSDGKTAATLNQIPAGGSVDGGKIGNNVAFYPYASTAGIEKSGVSYVISGVELPATQTYAAGSFGKGAFPMATVTSSTEDMNLKFKNVLGGLKLQLKGTATITSITVTGNNNEILCGDAEVTTTYGGDPSIALSDASAKTVTLDCGAGVNLDSETATPFIIALPPMTMTGGFTVVVTDREGKQMQIKTTKPQTITRSNLLKMPAVNYVGTPDYSREAFTITSTGSTSVSIMSNGLPANITLEYRKGTDSWTAYKIGAGVDLLNGEYIQFRAGEGGNESFSTSLQDYYYINVSGEGTVNLSGNIMSLLDRNLLKASVTQYAFYKFCTSYKIVDASNLKLPATTLAPGCYLSMFFGCTNLTTAPELPATTLANSCYSSMFSGCTSLTTAPELPATTLATECYSSMFSGCTSLTTAPELPATTLEEHCYQQMFSGCTSLTTAPALPATTLANFCYSSMFSGCTSLTTAPALPATTLADKCYYYMFFGCTNLTTAPELPATTLAPGCYLSMFFGCTSLTTAPALPATTLATECYSSMFSGCTSLTTAPELPATTLEEHCYQQMFSGCTSLTTAPALPATTLANFCYSSMFSGCTSLTTAPALPATTLATECYSYMFSGCTSLITAPALPATTLADKCYYYMFYNCTSLTTAPALPATTLAESCYYKMFSGCTNLKSAPELPATKLVIQCYYSMFSGCKSLTTAPDLPAQTLAIRCYNFMFDNCSSLNYIKMLATDISASDCLGSWVFGVSTKGTFVKSRYASWEVVGKHGVPSGWTIKTE